MSLSPRRIPLLLLGVALCQACRGQPTQPPTRVADAEPAPDPKFGGVIKNDALQSKAWWAPRIVPPKQAPNILLIMTDDCGFGAPSTFGGVVPTPLKVARSTSESRG